MKVSVIVPVYNTGEDLTQCVESVLAQTMDEFEVIFADDGSSDGTEKRLDELETEHDRVRVLHLPPSGGPGGPRNAGIEAARGEFVYFLDDDDWLGTEALERMHAMALRNDSDIVIGKMVGHGRRVPRLMFRESRDRADVLDDALCGILTPHKMFRRSFLNEHEIRFPEGPVRLEDHRFVLRAYFRARTISVVGDYACCHWMKRPGSYSRNLPDPVHYHDMLREVLDIVDEHVEPGPVRDRYYAHWYRGKILKRLGEGGLVDAPPDYRDSNYAEALRLTNERIGPGVDEWLPVRLRVRSALLRADAREDLFRLLTAERGTAVDAVLDEARWRGDRLAVRFTARFTYDDDTPVTFVEDRWKPPVPVDVPADLLAVDDRPWRLDLYIRRRSDNADFPLAITAEHWESGTMTGEAVLDVDEVPGLTEGTWDLIGRIDGGGWTYERRLRGYDHDLPARGRVEPYRTINDNLSIRIRGAAASPRKNTLRRTVRWLRRR
ncbi:glycosyltransferase family 2 protein [Actinomadura sp. DC4]|uniref:glycosyltransferase family 2 protein n=1 Tax=Actinomadura sp. DC4 TaxID=3055069 RepID=UPI0025B2797F|nr:glycosyltransferase family 2 protein [Actinomadura sp. DC4]MDN3351446.1 glycosyltransferase family 2 protein [Actinomadura sp. DC4]